MAKFNNNNTKYNNSIRKKKDNYKKEKDSNKEKYKLIQQLRKEIEKKEDEIARLKTEDAKKGNYRPNLFLFSEPEYTPLLDEKEKQELISSKEKVREELMALNPYDDKELDRLMQVRAELESKEQPSHPLDFIEQEPKREDTQEPTHIDSEK